MDKLASLIDERFTMRKDFAKALGISEQSLSKRLNNKAKWSALEMRKAVSLLKIPDKEVDSYFFTPKDAKKTTTEVR